MMMMKYAEICNAEICGDMRIFTHFRIREFGNAILCKKMCDIWIFAIYAAITINWYP